MYPALKNSKVCFLMVIALSLLLAGAPIMVAQTPQGTFRGIVKDTSGAVVPGAKITLTNERTTFSRSAVANARGEYEFPYVDPGTYTISAEKTGFKEFINAGIALNATQILRINIVLEVGSVASQVTVHGEAPAITTDKSDVTSTMNSRDIDNLSTIRIGDGPGRFQSGSDPSSGLAQLSFFGSRHNQTKFSLDGVENNFYQMYMPVDAVSEVKLYALDAPAEFMSPNELSMITAGGSNTLHGRFADYFTNWSAFSRFDYSWNAYKSSQ